MFFVVKSQPYFLQPVFTESEKVQKSKNSVKNRNKIEGSQQKNQGCDYKAQTGQNKEESF